MQLDTTAEVASETTVLQKRFTLRRILLTPSHTPRHANCQPLSPVRAATGEGLNHSSDWDFGCAAPATLAIIQPRK